MFIYHKMQNTKFLNRKEIKKILGLIKEQWGCEAKLDYVFLMNEKNKVYIVNRGIEKLKLENLRINSIGLYFGELNRGELRLTIEGSQIIGPKAKKNVLELNGDEVKEWMKGTDLDKDTGLAGFVIIKNNEDFLGTAKVKGRKILNYVPKIRRINTVV